MDLVFSVVKAMSNSLAEICSGKLGKLEGNVSLSTSDVAQPVIMRDRRIPIALRPKLKNELERLTEMKVICPVDEPTPWVSQICVIRKKSGDLRISLDPRELNKALMRENYTLPVLDDVLHEMSESRVFTKCDLSSGYWHCVLDENSSYLTTFQTVHGRFRWLRLPFGLSVSAEIFGKKLLEALDGLQNVVCIADDVVIHGKNVEEHDKYLGKFIERCKFKGIVLNPEKLELRKNRISFMGHCITEKGLIADPSKVEAVEKMPAPTNVKELRRFLGVINYLSKFIPRMADTTQPLRNLMKNDVRFTWSEAQDEAFKNVKMAITNSPVLALYDPAKELTVRV